MYVYYARVSESTETDENRSRRPCTERVARNEFVFVIFFFFCLSHLCFFFYIYRFEFFIYFHRTLDVQYYYNTTRALISSDTRTWRRMYKKVGGGWSGKSQNANWMYFYIFFARVFTESSLEGRNFNCWEGWFII